MSKLRFLVSLITKDNDFQMEQAASAKAAGGELGVEVQIVYAESDPITQSTQLLKAIQSDADEQPNAILVEPVGATSFPQAAKTAAQAGIGWAVLSREAEYNAELRKTSKSPVFSVSADQLEVGRIQGRQVTAILPRGGGVLLIQGPSVGTVSRERLAGLQEVIAPGIHLTNLRGRWTEESAHQSVGSWLKLMTAQKLRIDLIVAQNDAMAMGAKKAVQGGGDAETWRGVPIIGCDGVASTGQALVRTGQLTATVITPANTGEAMKLMAKAMRGGAAVPAHTLMSPTPFPAIEKLTPPASRG